MIPITRKLLSSIVAIVTIGTTVTTTAVSTVQHLLNQLFQMIWPVQSDAKPVPSPPRTEYDIKKGINTLAGLLSDTLPAPDLSDYDQNNFSDLENDTDYNNLLDYLRPKLKGTSFLKAVTVVAATDKRIHLVLSSEAAETTRTKNEIIVEITDKGWTGKPSINTMIRSIHA